MDKGRPIRRDPGLRSSGVRIVAVGRFDIRALRSARFFIRADGIGLVDGGTWSRRGGAAARHTGTPGLRSRRAAGAARERTDQYSRHTGTANALPNRLFAPGGPDACAIQRPPPKQDGNVYGYIPGPTLDGGGVFACIAGFGILAAAGRPRLLEFRAIAGPTGTTLVHVDVAPEDDTARLPSGAAALPVPATWPLSCLAPRPVTVMTRMQRRRRRRQRQRTPWRRRFAVHPEIPVSTVSWTDNVRPSSSFLR
jgi:hypothetical protein